METQFTVKGQTVVITGASRGIGLTFAQELGKAGARLALCANEPEITEVASGLREKGMDAFGRVVDITSKEDVVQFMRETVDTYGRIDVLVNNAGVLLRRTPEEITEQEWDFIQDVNVKGTFLCSQSAGVSMREAGRGSIINMASIAATRALSLRLAYCTSKAAVAQFTRSLACEWGRYGIRVNAIAPGYIVSDMNKDLRADPETYRQMVADVPLGRFGEQTDLVGMLIYLASSASQYVTGQVFYVDGGKTAH